MGVTAAEQHNVAQRTLPERALLERALAGAFEFARAVPKRLQGEP